MREPHTLWTLLLIVLALNLNAHSVHAQTQRHISNFSALATEQNRDQLAEHQKEGELEITFTTNLAPQKGDLDAGASRLQSTTGFSSVLMK